MKGMTFALAITAVGLSASAADAQQTLRLSVVDDFGAVSLAKPALVCFDPLAALDLEQDARRGSVGRATQEAFAVGSCLALDEGAPLADAQLVSIEDQAFVRGTLDDGVSVYIPLWGASLDGVEGGYDADRVAVAAPMFAAAAALKGDIDERRKCASETQALNKRIEDYNRRASAFSLEGEEPVTGSRIAGGASGTAPTLQIFLPSTENRELKREGDALKQEAGALDKRCREYRDDLTLDRDYLAYYGLGD